MDTGLIENSLLADPSVVAVCALSNVNDRGIEQCYAFVVLRQNTPRTIYDFFARCSEHPGLLSVKIRLLPDMPRGPEGAISRIALAHLLHEPQFAGIA